MSRLPRLLRALHTTAPRLEALAAPATTAVSTSTSTSAAAPPVTFTPKGRPIVGRPPRATRVTLPSGFPEPPAYPPPAAYFDEVAQIEAGLPAGQKPRAHPLWAFFHVPEEARDKLKPGARMPDLGSLERLDDEAAGLASGRSWTAAELRQKSFEDLHTLWYVLLRERNVLATQREERRRMGIVADYGGELLTKRAFRCRKTMSRIKYVLNERRLGLIAAGAALKPAPEGVVAPTTVPGANDPMAAVEALHGAAPPDLSHIVARKAKTDAKAAAQLELFETAAKAE